MNLRRYYFVFIILALAAIIGIVYWSYHEVVPLSTPRKQYSFNITSLDSGLSLPIFNVTQGSNQQLNLTLAPNDSGSKISLPIENITLTSYNSTISYDRYIDWDNRNWNRSLVQETVFNYTCSLNPVILQSNETVSTIITLQWANDAPVGRYTIDVTLGQFSFLSTPEDHVDQLYAQTFTLFIIVNPKTN
jgi:hypothetical protein